MNMEEYPAEIQGKMAPMHKLNQMPVPDRRYFCGKVWEPAGVIMILS